MSLLLPPETRRKKKKPRMNACYQAINLNHTTANIKINLCVNYRPIV